MEYRVKKLVVVPLFLSLLVPAVVQAADAQSVKQFEEKDFQWDPFFNLYKRVVIVGVNKMVREHPSCANVDPHTLVKSGGTPDDPEFQILCGENKIRFTKAEITGDPGTNVPLVDREAQQH